MKFYIDCVSGYSKVVNIINELYKSESESDKDVVKLCEKFKKCFNVFSTPSVCGRRVIEIQDLFTNLRNTMEELDGFSYLEVKMVLDSVFKGITESNCADDSDNWNPKPY